MVTFASGLFILPFFLFSALAGDLADKYERSWLCQKIKQVEIVLMFLCALSFYFQSIIGLLVILFLMGVQSTFFGPIKYSLLPAHLQEKELVKGNGFIEGGTFLAILLGTIFGGLIVRLPNGIFILGGCIIGCAILGFIGSLFIPKAPIGDRDLHISWNIFQGTWRLIKNLKQNKFIWHCVLCISWFWFVGATFLMQFPPYVKQTLQGNEQVVTLCLTVFSLGIGLGSLACHRLLKGKVTLRLAPWGLMGMTLMILDLFVASFYYNGQGLSACTTGASVDCSAMIGAFAFLSQFQGIRIAIDLLFIAFFSGIYIVPFYAMLQAYAQKSYVSRVIAGNNIINSLFMVLASVLGAILHGVQFTSYGIFLAVGLLNIGLFCLIFTWVRRLRDPKTYPIGKQ